MELTRNLSESFRPQSYQPAEPLWTDPGMKTGISVRELISTPNNKAQAGNEWLQILPRSLQARKKPSLHTGVPAVSGKTWYNCLILNAQTSVKVMPGRIKVQQIRSNSVIHCSRRASFGDWRGLGNIKLTEPGITAQTGRAEFWQQAKYATAGQIRKWIIFWPLLKPKSWATPKIKECKIFCIFCYSKMDSDFRQCMINRQITHFVDDRLCGYLWNVLTVCRYTWQTACWLLADYLELSHDGVANYAHTLPSGQFKDSWNLFVLLEAIMAKVVINWHTPRTWCLHVFHMVSLRSRACVQLIGYWIETARLTNEPSTSLRLYLESSSNICA